MNKLEFIKDVSTDLEIVSISYPEHTHIGHYIFGIITKGTVKIVINRHHLPKQRIGVYS